MNQYRFILIFLLAFAICSVNGRHSYATENANTCRILFIGNSFTGYNDMPGIVRELAITSKKNIFVDCFLRYGRCLYDISQNPQLKDKINQQQWDCVVLQDGPHNAAYPDSYQALIPYAQYSPLPLTLQIIRDLALANCESTRVVYFMPWAFKDGITWIAGQTDSYQEMQKKIHDNAIQFANELNLLIAPVGWAWYQVIQERSDIDLFNPDWSHASLEGSYLAACVFYAAFFQERVASSYFCNLPAVKAQYFQSIASSIVMDNRDLWNITVIEVDKPNPQNPLSFRLYQNYPNPFNSSTQIGFRLAEKELIALNIYDARGRKVAALMYKELTPGEHCITFNADRFASGAYFYQLKTGQHISTRKMILVR